MDALLQQYADTVRSLLNAKHNQECLDVFVLNQMEIEQNNHDNWNGGIDFYTLKIAVYPTKYQELKDNNKLDGIKNTLIELFHDAIPDNHTIIDTVQIYPDASLEYDERENITSNNKIPFYIYRVDSPYITKSTSKPQTVPAFILLGNTWDDYGVKTKFGLNYFDENSFLHYIGAVKIIDKSPINDNGYKTLDVLRGQFTDITDSFCSLGQDVDYYTKLKALFPDTYRDLLLCLRDCAVFPDVENSFRTLPQFRSLIRTNEAERLLREVKFRLMGQEIKTRYVFDYLFKPKYADESIRIHFHFSQDGYQAHRIYAIIGENGVGKTQFISSFPMSIYKNKKELFQPHVPIFSKIIALSNCPYDSFEIPHANQGFGYVYCGISKKIHDVKTIISDIELKQGLTKSLKIIRARGWQMVTKIRTILSNLLSDEELEMLFTEDNDGISLRLNDVSVLCDRLSSGQNALLYQFCNVAAHIRYDSIILFDEPETHMHPNAITMLMSALYKLLDDFDSYCIIVTHSPLVVREVRSECVYVMTREDNHPDITKIGIESFGADTSVIIDEVFGNREAKMPYKTFIREMITDGLSYEDIVQALERDGISLGLHLLLYIKSQLTKV